VLQHVGSKYINMGTRKRKSGRLTNAYSLSCTTLMVFGGYTTPLVEAASTIWICSVHTSSRVGRSVRLTYLFFTKCIHRWCRPLRFLFVPRAVDHDLGHRRQHRPLQHLG
jgi:hypothetical protein